MFCPYPPQLRLASLAETAAISQPTMPDGALLAVFALIAVVVVAIVILGRAVRRVQMVAAATVSVVAPVVAWGYGSNGVSAVSLEVAGRGALGAALIAVSCAMLWTAFRIGRRF